jgi:Meckel syndrome type 1 protein
VATPPSAAATARTPLNLSLPRGESAARRGPGLLDLLPQPPERKSEMQKRIEEAGREDCRNAHADKGLLAIVPLVLAPARDKGCKY